MAATIPARDPSAEYLEPVKLNGQGPKAKHCSSLNQAMFDLDNDGKPDLVVKSKFCSR